MGKSKGSRITITLECIGKDASSKGIRRKGAFRYTSTKNRKNTPERIELRKFCPDSNCHKIFKEIK